MRYFLLLLLTLPMVCPAQQHKQISMIDSIFNQTFRENEPGAAILIAKDGKVIYRNARGIADTRTGERITTQTLFNVGSITKPIVAYGILKLAYEGRLSLEDEIIKYFPEFKNKDIARKVRIYHLLTHTSGLPDVRKIEEEREFYLTARDAENFAPLMQVDSLEFEPGTKYKYSNPAFNGLALIIEKLTGEKWQEYIRKQIFEPSGMKSSTITDGPHPETGVSHAYVKKDGKFEELDYGEEPTFPAAGNGGVWSSVEELCQLEQAIQQNKFLPAEWMRFSRTKYPFRQWKDKMSSRLGLSWFITDWNKMQMIGHTGSQGGFVGDYVWIPEKKIFYVLLCNIPHTVEDIRNKLLPQLAN